MHTEPSGSIQQSVQQGGCLILQTKSVTARVWVYAPSIIRVSIGKDTAPQSDDASFAVIQEPQTEISYTEDAQQISIDTGALILKIEKAPLRFNFYTPDGRWLDGDADRFGTVWQSEQVSNYRKLLPGERFIGLGEKTGPLDRRGQQYVNWNTDAVDYGLKTDPLYKTFPFFIGLHGKETYGLFLDNTHKTYFDFGASTDHTMYWMAADGGDLNYYFFGAQGIAQIIQDYTWLTGRMEMPPLWSQGYQQCRWSYMSAQEILQVAHRFRSKKIPADVMYCDIDYMDGYKIFTWDKKTFPDPKALLDELKAIGFKLVTIVDPGIKIEKGYREYDEGIKHNYFATYPNGELYTGEVWPGRCHFPDFFNEKVRQWWGRAFKALTQPGVAGFWNDMNEPAAWGQNIPSIVHFGKQPMPAVRNAYGMQMARATYNGTRELLKGQRPFVLTRAAYAGIQRYSAVWTGDNTATDAHLLLGARLVNSLGLTGVAFTGVDIGGFSGNPTPELMVRWNSLGVYTPMFRNHAMIGTVRREPWAWGAANQKIIRKDIELRYRLLPYLYSTFYQAAQSGLPVCRTLAIDHPFDDRVFDQHFQNQFYFGDNLLVAPAESTAQQIKVYLPKGKWYRFSTGKEFRGNRVINADAPLTDLPVFVKAGAIIPMQGVVQNTSEPGNGVLELHIWNGNKASEFIYYEDDGQSYDYQHGAYYKRSIRFEPTRKYIVFAEAEGAFSPRFNQVKLVMHGFEKSARLTVNGKKLTGGLFALTKPPIFISY